MIFGYSSYRLPSVIADFLCYSAEYCVGNRVVYIFAKILDSPAFSW